MKVELIYFEGCPNIAKARAALVKAFATISHPITWVEWNQSDNTCPDRYRIYGSPTILIDGQDVDASTYTEQGACCRLYTDDNTQQTLGAPSLNTIVAALKNAGSTPTNAKPISKWLALLTAIPSVLIAILPKLTCPMCWPAYTAILASLGISFVNYTPYLPMIITSLLVIALVSLSYNARHRHGYKPLALGILGSSSILLGQFVLINSILFYAGSAILIVAAIWNAWPKRKRLCQTRSCCPDSLPKEKNHEQ